MTGSVKAVSPSLPVFRYTFIFKKLYLVGMTCWSVWRLFGPFVVWACAFFPSLKYVGGQRTVFLKVSLSLLQELRCHIISTI